MIETITLQPGVTLRCFHDSRFKQGALSLQFLRPQTAAEAAANALIPAVLLRGTNHHPTMRSITQQLDTLYGASISPLVRRVGDYQAAGVTCEFMDDRFALTGETVLEPLLAFLKEILLDSPLENGGFLPDFVEQEKKNQISAIESEMNDKRTYTVNRLLRTLCAEDSFGLPRIGEPEDVRAITPQSLYAQYQVLLREAPVDIFYVGSRDAETMARLLTPIFSDIPRSPVPLPPQTGLRTPACAHLSEAMEITQGKLCMGFVTDITSADPRFPAMQVFSTIYGGGMTSKLFRFVREQQSLCYSVSSGYYSAKGIVLVSAGIDFDKEQQTREEIMHQLDECIRGNITPEELAAAKNSLLSALRTVHDAPLAIENYYETWFLSTRPRTTAEHMAQLRAVELADVVEMAKSLRYCASYFLKGAQA